MYKTFQALVSYTQGRREVRRRELGADMEYRWWLAKRVMKYWQYARYLINKKRELELTVA